MYNTILIGVLASLFASSAFAAPCNVPGKEDTPKWQVPLTVHELVKSRPTGTTLVDVATWSFAQQTSFYSKFLQDSPQAACNAWALGVSPGSITFTPTMRARNKAFKHGSTYTCAFDCDNDNHINAEDDTSNCAQLVGRETKPWAATDPVCDLDTNVQNPKYADGTTGPTTDAGYIRGAPFTDAQKLSFIGKNANLAPQAGTIKSDGYQVPAYDPDFHAWFLHADFDQFLSPNAGYLNSVQWDHLVPRVDRYGCGCGTNSPRNAAAVSAQLNNGMSNDSQNSVRVALLCYYAKWPGCPGTPFPRLGPGVAANPADAALAPISDYVDDTDGDASNTPNEIGGCAVGGATDGGVALSLIGLGMLVQRRKRIA
jgi:MYXO-CTERM domain-containing protein